MQIYRLCTGEPVHRYQQSIVVQFTGKRRVLSTGPHNGGMHDDLTAVFNNDCKLPSGIVRALKAPTYAGHVALLSEELGLDSRTTTGITTAAQMKNAAIRTETYKDITVTAIVTGGIEVNGGRVGDPASWDELEDAPIDLDSQPDMDPKMDPHANARKKDRLAAKAKEEAETAAKQESQDSDLERRTSGTINIMLFINVDLTPNALARSLVTCTEAKSAALQELMAASRYSNGLATGSGTDGTIIVANAESKIQLDDAGKHGKLGELIGRSVKAALKEALYLQSGLGPQMQKSVIRRVDRFGITPEKIWEELVLSVQPDRGVFWDALEKMTVQEELVAEVSLYVHLMDQMNWGLFSSEVVYKEAEKLLVQISGGDIFAVTWPDSSSDEETVAVLTKQLQTALVNRLRREIPKE